MRSGWPHTQEEPGLLASQQQAQFGPIDSWPDGYPALGRDDGDYRYQQQHGMDPYAAQPYAPAAGEGGGYPYGEFGSQGQHAQAGNNYAAPEGYGYGDPGYGNPGYDGPSSQDTGVPGPGFVDASGPHAGADLAYPAHGAPVGEQPGQSPDVYHQPWDYNQPLRYDDDPAGSPQMDAYGQTTHPPQAFNGGYSADGFGPGQDFSGGAPGFSSHGLHAAPVVNDFQSGGYDQPGYDQPGYDRLSYDDPRYDSRFGGGVDQFGGDSFDAFGSGAPDTSTRFDMPAVDDAPRHNDTRFDMPAVPDAPRHSDTRFDMPALGSEADADAFQVDHFWPAREEVNGSESGSGAFGTLNQTSMDLAGDQKNDTRFDMPAVDDYSYGDSYGDRFPATSADGMPALDEFASGGAPEFRAANTGGLVMPADEEPVNWADETSFDRYADDFGTGPHTAFQAPESQPFAIPESGPMPAATTGAQRKAPGKRRGQSRDKREWIALGAIAVVAAGAIGGVMMKFVFSGPSGPQHTISTPEKVGDFSRQPSLEQQMKVGQLKSSIMAKGDGKISDPVASVYQSGSSALGSTPETYIFVGGKLANADPVAEVDNFRKTAQGAKFVNPGMDGDAACGTASVSGESVSMCVWFDNDTFGELVSPSMQPAQLAKTMLQARPQFEHTASSK